MSAIFLFVVGAVVMWGRQFYDAESGGSLAQQGTAVPLGDSPQGQEAEAINPAPTISMSEAWILSSDMAKQGLWSLVSATPLTGELCEQSPAEGYRCEQSDADVWDQLLANNRPAILTVRRRNGFAGSALIVGLE